MEFIVHRTQPVETRRRNVNVSLETSLADADRSLLTGTFSVSTERERRCSTITRTGSFEEGCRADPTMPRYRKNIGATGEVLRRQSCTLARDLPWLRRFLFGSVA